MLPRHLAFVPLSARPPGLLPPLVLWNTRRRDSFLYSTSPRPFSQLFGKREKRTEISFWFQVGGKSPCLSLSLFCCFPPQSLPDPQPRSGVVSPPARKIRNKIRFSSFSLRKNLILSLISHSVYFILPSRRGGGIC